MLVWSDFASSGLIKTYQELLEIGCTDPLLLAFYKNDLVATDRLLPTASPSLKAVLLSVAIEQSGELLEQKVKLLIRHQVNPLKSTCSLDLPVHLAARYNHLTIVKLLLEHAGVKGNYKNLQGKTVIEVVGQDVPDQDCSALKEFLTQQLEQPLTQKEVLRSLLFDA